MRATKKHPSLELPETAPSTVPYATPLHTYLLFPFGTASSWIQNPSLRHPILCTATGPVQFLRSHERANTWAQAAQAADPTQAARRGARAHRQRLGTRALARSGLRAAISQGFQQTHITNSWLQLTLIRKCFIKLKHQSEKEMFA